MDYCVYVTIYRGNILPPFYIGSSSLSRVNNGYNGSPSSEKYRSIWRLERRENPSRFKTIVIKKFETRQEASNFELKLQILLKVHKNPLYTNMGYFHGGHIVYEMALENCKKMVENNKGKPRTEETKIKISESNKGKTVSEETRIKIGIASKNRLHRKLTNDEKKMISERQLGDKHHFYGKHLSTDHKNKLSLSTKGRKNTQHTIDKMTKQKWLVKEKESDDYYEIQSITSWCLERNLPVRDVRKGFKRSGKYKNYYGILIE